jgi:hypothetical protein
MSCLPARIAATLIPRNRPTTQATHANPILHAVQSDGGASVSILWATWITALATAGLLIGAFITAIYAAKALRKQSEEVTLAREQAERDIQERRRAQAAGVFIVIATGVAANPGVLLEAQASNTSRQPVYDIEVQWRTSDGQFGQPAAKPQLLPQEMTTFPQHWTADQGITGLGVSIAFRDAAGIHWQTTDRGELTELCGRLSPTRDRCTVAPGHQGRHSWE